MTTVLVRALVCCLESERISLKSLSHFFVMIHGFSTTSRLIRVFLQSRREFPHDACRIVWNHFEYCFKRKGECYISVGCVLLAQAVSTDDNCIVRACMRSPDGLSCFPTFHAYTNPRLVSPTAQRVVNVKSKYNITGLKHFSYNISNQIKAY